MVRRFDGRWVPKRNAPEEKTGRHAGGFEVDNDDDNDGPPRKKQKHEKGSFIGTHESSVKQSGNSRLVGKGGKGDKGGGKGDRDRSKKKRPEMGTVTKGKKGMRREIKSADQIKKQRRVAEYRQKKVAKGKRVARTKGKKGRD